MFLSIIDFIASQEFFIMIGGAIFIALTIFRLDKTGIGNNKVNRLLIVCIISAFGLYLSARFFDCLWHAIDNNFFERIPELIDEHGFFGMIFKKTKVENPEQSDLIGFFDQGGITFLGGLYGALITYAIAYWFIFRNERHNLIHYLNYIIPGLVIAHSFGRVGCFFDGCCYGITVRLGQADYALPTNLFEAFFLLILFFIILFACKKHQTKIYMVSYGVFRFFIEFLRGDNRGKLPFIDWLSPSQLLSIILLIVGILLFIFEDKLTNWVKRFNKEPKNKKTVEKANA